MLEAESCKAEEDLSAYFDADTRSFLVQNVTVQSEEGEESGVDVLVSEGKIVLVESNIARGGAVVVRGEGKRLGPGAVSVSGDGARGVTTLLQSATHNLTQLLAHHQDKLANTNTGLFISLKDINYLYSKEVEEIVSAGVNTFQLSLAKMNNKQLLETFKRLKHLGCRGLVRLDLTELESALGRVGVVEICREELEESQARRVSTLAQQVGVSLCIENISSLPALALINQFRRRGAPLYAGLTDSLLDTLKGDLTYEDVVISHKSSSVKMSSTNPAKFLGIFPAKGSLSRGADADLVLWEEDDSPVVVMVNGQMVEAHGQTGSNFPGQFVPLPSVREGRDKAAKRVERKEEVKKTEEVNNMINIDPSKATEADQVPGIFQRRVSAFGIRNQQDSTFNLTQPDSYSEEQCHSLTGSRRASVKVHAPPGGLSSGFW